MEYAEFNGDGHFFCFWPRVSFLGKFGSKHQSSQNSKFAMSLEYLKKKLEIKLISTLWVSKFFTRWYIIIDRSDQALSKYCKVTSLQYPCSFSKKKLRMEFIFCMQINIKFLMELGLHVQSTQNRKLVIFLLYIKEKVSLLCSIVLWCKTLRYVMGSSHVSGYLFCFRPEMPFLCKFGPKIQSCQFKLKFGV